MCKNVHLCVMKISQDEDNSQDSRQMIRQENYSIKEGGKEGPEYVL